MVTITTKIDPTAQEFPYLRPLVERAAGWLGPIVEDSPEPIEAEWSAFYDTRSKGPLVTLRLGGTHPQVHAGRVFTASELADEPNFRFSALGTYRDFLRSYSRHLRAAYAGSDTGTGEG